MNSQYILHQSRKIQKMYIILQLLLFLFNISGTICVFLFVNEPEMSFYWFNMYVSFQFISICYDSYYEYIFHINRGIFFNSSNDYLIWKNNIGIIYFSETLKILDFLLSLIIVGLHWPMNTTIDNNENVIYLASILIIHIKISVYFFIGLLMLSGVCLGYICYKISDFYRWFINKPQQQIQLPIVSLKLVIDDCCICMENTPNENWTKINCGHIFHTNCLLKWMKSGQENSKTCPICRNNI
jgi:hypothetical protein